jgi:hypothetical protein
MSIVLHRLPLMSVEETLQGTTFQYDWHGQFLGATEGGMKAAGGMAGLIVFVALQPGCHQSTPTCR